MKELNSAKLPLSVVLISLNEQSNIGRAVQSVIGWADEVLVYDSGSTDQTCEIALKMGARVEKGEWKGFGPTKALATSLARHSWILSIDCDEEVSSALAEELKSKWSELDSSKAYRVPRLSYYLKRWIRHGGWYPDYQVRLFNREKSGWDQSVIHEKVQAASYDILVSHLNHYVFKNIEHQVQTNNRYSTLQAAQMHKAGKSYSLFHFLTKPTVKFVECYIWKLGFLDGWAGYLIARSAAYSVLLKWSKLYELERLN
ncbi:MAG: glycosyltransferase family 2 protein [Bdellovibrionaceae bacterium]|nr:glycosyltransferase family 2 protein [Pseudobdellovibrionaceae bacterium]